MRIASALFLSISLSLLSFTLQAGQHGLAMHGTLKYPASFKHFDYVNPDAPKGGTLRLGVVGDNFDSLNPFIIKGVPASGVSYLYQGLTVHAEDEAFSEYGLIAEKIEMPEDRSYVVFYLNPNARFSDGEPIQADDIKFSFELVTTHEKARPFYAAYYADVTEVKIIDDLTVRFNFKDDQNKELPLILGQIPVLAKHYWEKHDFGSATLTPPVTNGPYIVKDVQPGRSITYERDKNYWAKDHPTVKGYYNFDQIIFEYYKDNTIALEAFKAGEYDYRVEHTARNWATSYVGPPFEQGTLIKEEIAHERPAGMQAFVMNSRRDLFKDARVRQALNYAFDFEWTNQNLFFGQYQRSHSFFENSELASSGLPQGEELAILKQFEKQLPDEIFTQAYEVPTTTPPHSIRKNLRTAINLLKAAGWEIKNKQLVHKDNGKPFEFEFLIYQKDFERVVQPFIKNLEKLGIVASIRVVDTSQYLNRLRDFDFDVVVAVFGQSNSPGNEQREYWHSSRANQPGSRNFAGISDPVIDALIDMVIQAPDRDSLVQRTRALDRVLLHGHYVIPNWYNPVDRVAYHKKLKRPANTPKSGVNIDHWWMKAE